MSSDGRLLSGKKILVAGSGVAGLSFAIALSKQWPAHSSAPVPQLVLYERETRANLAGREGYSMSLRGDLPGGVQACQKLGILDAMIANAVSVVTDDSPAGFCIWDRNWRSVMKVSSKPPTGLPVGGLRIARSKMRAVLIDAAIAAGCDINWGVACTGISRCRDGRFEVQLSNGATDTADVVVVADGAKSKIRTQLRPNDGLDFLGVCVIGAISHFDGRPPKPIDQDWGTIITGAGVALFASPVGENSALWSVSFLSKTRRDKKSAPLSEAVKRELMESAREKQVLFPPLFKRILEHTDEDTLMAFNAEDKAPFRHDNKEWRGVMFIGDANHAVSPFAGNGANMALCDGWDLAAQLCTASSIDDAITKYDALVVPRSTKVWKNSHFNINVGHSVGWTSWGYMNFLRIVGLLVFRGARSAAPED